MSFETWYDKYPDTTEYVTGMRDAYEAGRAESEAQIAALKDSHIEVEMQLVALQSERDALREALLPFKPSDENVFAYMELAHPDKPRKYPITVTDRDLLRVHSLLSTPASGEPARKP